MGSRSWVIAASALAVLQWARFGWAAWQAAHFEAVVPRREPAAGESYPSVSLIVPARNEAANIGACLAGASAQRVPGLEILVLDDRSEDNTALLVRDAAAHDPRIRLLEGQPLPEGWIGKCWALHQAAAAARSEWLLFVDADTRLLPGAIAGAIDAARQHGAAVLSVLTGQELPTWWEKMVQPAVFGAIAEAMPITLVNNPHLPQFALANGQFLLARRDAYDAMGGHAAIRREIAEDVQFAKRAKRLGWSYWLGDGRLLARTRMYQSIGDLWEGWTKNLHTGAKLLPWLVLPGTAYLVATLALPYFCLALGRRYRSAALMAAGGAQIGALLARRRLLDSVAGVPPGYTFTEPVGDAAFVMLLLASYYKVLTRQGVTWKGRRYYGAG